MPDVISIGEALIDFVPGQVDCLLQEVSDFHRAAGGAPANVAVGLARLGIEAGFMGKVGNDAFGKFLRNTLENNEVDTEQIVMTDEAMTTLAFVSLRSDGERDFAFYRKPGADMLYKTEEIDINYLKQASIFHFGSISLINDPVRTTVLELVKFAKDNGILVSFDPNIRPPLWSSLGRAIEEIKGALSLSDFIKLNEEELITLTDIKLESIDNLDQGTRTQLVKGCQEIYNQGPDLVIVTLGKLGSFYYSSTGKGYVEGENVKTIDTTGAGDGFVAAILSKLNNLMIRNNFLPEKILSKINVNKLEEMLAFANRVAAITTTQNGGIPSLPTIKELKEK